MIDVEINPIVFSSHESSRGKTMTENEGKLPAADAQQDVAQADQDKADQDKAEPTDELTLDELSWEALDGVAGGVVGTATLIADLSD
jgi:hypothetical protein